MPEPTCPRCSAQLGSEDLDSMFGSIPEADREAFLRRMTVRRSTPFARAGRFVQQTDGTERFEPLGSGLETVERDPIV